MPNVEVNVIQDFMKLDELCNEFAKLQRTVRWILNGNIDWENIRAKSIIADNIDVDKLSAISADLGTITAGIIRGIEIYGSYIATSEGTYPRTEMDVSGDLLGAYAAANKYVRIAALNGTTSAPSMIFSDGSQTYYIYASSISNELIILGTGNISLGSSGRTVEIAGATLQVPNWSLVYSAGASQTLQQALNDKANFFIGYTGTVTVVTGVDFATDTFTTSDLEFTNGILSVVI